MPARLPILPLIVGCLLFFTQEIHAQTSTEFRIAFQDSMMLKEGFRLLSNNIAISNPNPEVIELGVNLRVPKNWREINPFKNGEYDTLRLKKDESINIPLNLLASSRTEAGWDSVSIKVWNLKTKDTFNYYPRISVEPKYRFSMQAINPDQTFVDGKPDSVRFFYKVQNTGNTTNRFTFETSCKSLSLVYHIEFTLPPQADSTLTFSVPLSDDDWKDLYSERVVFEGKCANVENSSYATFAVNRPTSTIYKNKASRLYFPITIGGGVIVNGIDVRYFGEISTSLKLGNHNFSASYRTRDLGPLAYTFQRNILNVNYFYKGFSATYGQVAAPKNFFSIARGATLRYDDYRRGWGISVSGMKHDPLIAGSSFKNDNVFVGGYYHIKKVVVRHGLESNFDSATGINSYLFYNDVKILDRSNLLLKLNGGVGYSVSAVNEQLPNIQKTTFGYSAGYIFLWNLRGWMLNSSTLYSDSRYPGITGGYFSQIHNLMKQFGNLGVGVSYYSNTTKQKALRDTLFNSDFLQVNNTKYGINLSYNTKRQISSLSFGEFKQGGDGTHILNNGWYLDAIHNLNLGRYQSLSATARSAMLYQPDGTPFVTLNSALRLKVRNFSILGTYNRLPLLNNDNSGIRAVQTVNGGPNVDFNLFKNRFAGSVRYNISKTISETIIRHGFGAQLNYSSVRGEFNISASGFIPLRDPGNITIPVGETRYASLTLNKRISVPYKRLNVSDVNVLLYQDLNSSGHYEPSDSLMTNLPLVIDNRTLVTDQSGAIHYRNVQPGTYELSLLNTKTQNLVPIYGGVQKVVLENDDTTIEVPFRKGKRIFGTLVIDRDTLGTIKLDPDNFKIIVSDSIGNTQMTLTDINGKFELFVPEGVYTVALPGEYFKGTDFKPVQLTYNVDLTKQEDAEVTFTVKQKKRVVRFLEEKK
jgi:hypothetical protein